MTPPKVADVAVAAVVEFHCPRRCSVEIDLAGVSLRFTLGQIVANARTAHAAAHTANPPQRVYVHGAGILVRAGQLVEEVRS
jgi:hypothetical protein